MGKFAAEELERKIKMLEIVDSIIITVGTEIQNRETLPEKDADTIMALASLIGARATLV